MQPTLPYTGGCLCGAVRYECHAPPKSAFICHCNDCKKYTGAPFSAFIILAAEDVRLLSGTPRRYEREAASGNSTSREFCPECGGSLFGRISPYPNILTVDIGSLDDASWVRPKGHLWTKRELDWAHIEDGLERHEENA